MVNLNAPDFTQHPPRSPRCRLGGFVHLPRLLDKARAHAAGKLGEYKWNCPLDQRFTAFTGVDIEAMLAEVKQGRSDTEMLAWVMANSKPKRDAWEIAAWSDWLSNVAPGNVQRHTMFAEEINRNAPGREDIATFFDRLELDDFVCYGGKG